MSNWVLAIDFGTSNTAVATTHPVTGAPQVVNLSHASTTMPSAVYVDKAGRIHTGDVAQHLAEQDPAGFIPSPKRALAQPALHIAGRELDPAAPAAAVLTAAAAKAMRAHNNTRPSRVVLTHPEAWSEEELLSLRRAAAPLGPTQTLSEPKAAAHYYSRNQDVQPGQRLAVFDFGGGTLDTAVLEMQGDGTFRTLAARGEAALGGRSFDARIRAWVEQQLERSHPEALAYLRGGAGGATPAVTPAQRRALERDITRAKELLSEAPSASISVPTPAGAIRLQLTRKEFEDLIAEPVARAVDLARATLADADRAAATAPAALTAIYLTGGSSRVPYVQESLKELGPVATLDDPKTVVCQGAIVADQQRHPAPASTSPAPAAAQTVVAQGGRSSIRKIAPVVLVAGIALAGVALVPRNSEPASEPIAEAEPAPETQLTETIAVPDGLDGWAADMYRAVPASLRDVITDCEGVEGRYDILNQLECRMEITSAAGPYMDPERDYLHYIVFDQDSRRIELDVLHSEPSYSMDFYRSSDGQRQASMLRGESLGSSLTFSAIDLNLSFYSPAFANNDRAVDFLYDTGLLS